MLTQAAVRTLRDVRRERCTEDGPFQLNIPLCIDLVRSQPLYYMVLVLAVTRVVVQRLGCWWKWVIHKRLVVLHNRLYKVSLIEYEHIKGKFHCFKSDRVSWLTVKNAQPFNMEFKMYQELYTIQTYIDFWYCSYLKYKLTPQY